MPGTRWRFGLDPLLGLLPVAGDTVGAALSLWIVYQALRLDAPPAVLARMLGNVALDFAAGSIPLLGDLFDAGFKANLKNVALLQKSLAKTHFQR